MKLLAVYTTVGSREDARALASSLVEQGLVACAQVQEIESCYRWKGALQHEPEFRLVFKTTEARYAQVEAAILAAHPYELPAVHAVAVAHAHGPYAAWVEEGVAAA